MALPPHVLLAMSRQEQKRKNRRDINKAIGTVAPIASTAAGLVSAYNDGSYNPSVGLGAAAGAVQGGASALSSGAGIFGALGFGALGAVTGAITSLNQKEKMYEQEQNRTNNRLYSSLVGNDIGLQEIMEAKKGGQAVPSEDAENPEQQMYIPVQTEADEMMAFADGSLQEVHATKKHSEMKKDHVTDVVPIGTYIFPESVKLSKKDLESLITYSVGDYSENGQDYKIEEVRLTTILGDKFEGSFADAARVIKRKYPVTVDKRGMNGITDKSNDENMKHRLTYINHLIRLNEAKLNKEKVEDNKIVPSMMAKKGGYADIIQSYKAGGGVNPDPKKKSVVDPNKATKSDSLLIYNNALKKNSFYYNDSNYGARDSETNNKDISQIIYDVKNYSKIYNESASKNVDINKVSTKDNRFKMLSSNLAQVGDILRGMPDAFYHPKSPPILLSDKILPQKWVGYGKRGTDMSDVPYYDPIAVKPVSMLTPLELIARKQKYPNSFVKNAETDTETTKGTVRGKIAMKSANGDNIGYFSSKIIKKPTPPAPRPNVSVASIDSIKPQGLSAPQRNIEVPDAEHTDYRIGEKVQDMPGVPNLKVVYKNRKSDGQLIPVSVENQAGERIPYDSKLTKEFQYKKPTVKKFSKGGFASMIQQFKKGGYADMIYAEGGSVDPIRPKVLIDKRKEKYQENKPEPINRYSLRPGGHDSKIKKVYKSLVAPVSKLDNRTDTSYDDPNGLDIALGVINPFAWIDGAATVLNSTKNIVTGEGQGKDYATVGVTAAGAALGLRGSKAKSIGDKVSKFVNNMYNPAAGVNLKKAEIPTTNTTSNQLPEPPHEIILDNINISRTTPKVQKKMPSFDDVDLGSDLTLRNNPSRITNPEDIMGKNRSIKSVLNKKTNESIDLKSWTDSDGEIYYYMAASMPSSKIKAGRAYLELEKHIPKGKSILESSSLSYDSFLNIVKQTKNPKFETFIKGTLPMNNSAKNTLFKNKPRETAPLAEWSYKKDADEAVDELNLLLDKHNLPKANVVNEYGNYSIQLPNIGLKKLYGILGISSSAGALVVKNNDNIKKMEKGGFASMIQQFKKGGYARLIQEAPRRYAAGSFVSGPGDPPKGKRYSNKKRGDFIVGEDGKGYLKVGDKWNPVSQQTYDAFSKELKDNQGTWAQINNQPETNADMEVLADPMTVTASSLYTPPDMSNSFEPIKSMFPRQIPQPKYSNRYGGLGNAPEFDPRLPIDETGILKYQEIKGATPLQEGKNGLLPKPTSVINDDQNPYGYNEESGVGEYIGNMRPDSISSLVADATKNVQNTDSTSTTNPFDEANDMLDMRAQEAQYDAQVSRENYSDLFDRMGTRDTAQLITALGGLGMQDRTETANLKSPYYLAQKNQKFTAHEINAMRGATVGDGLEGLKNLGRTGEMNMAANLAPVVYSKLVGEGSEQGERLSTYNKQQDQKYYNELGQIRTANDTEMARVQNVERDNNNKYIAETTGTITEFMASRNDRDIDQVKVNEGIERDLTKKIYAVQNQKFDLKFRQMDYEDQMKDIEIQRESLKAQVEEFAKTQNLPEGQKEKMLTRLESEYAALVQQMKIMQALSPTPKK